jgi:zinc transport system ATP-binding protein
LLPLIIAKQVEIKFAQKPILIDVHLTVNPGQIVTLIGPNGAGKSTLVRAVLGLIKPTSGVIHLKKGIHVGYMPQKLKVESFMPLTVERFLRLAGSIEKEQFQNVVKELRVVHLQSSPIQSISGGELQRVLLARALLRKPDLLVLDEPVQGVDVSGQEELYKLIMRIRDQYGCGILMVSHDLHLVMAGTDLVVCLNQHVCCSGSPAAVSKHPEFLNLFGARDPAGLAVYAHRHDHTHDSDDAPCI